MPALRSQKNSPWPRKKHHWENPLRARLQATSLWVGVQKRAPGLQKDSIDIPGSFLGANVGIAPNSHELLSFWFIAL